MEMQWCIGMHAWGWLTTWVLLALPPTKVARVAAVELMNDGLEIRIDCRGSDAENGLLRVTLKLSLSGSDSVIITVPCKTHPYMRINHIIHCNTTVHEIQCNLTAKASPAKVKCPAAVGCRTYAARMIDTSRAKFAPW